MLLPVVLLFVSLVASFPDNVPSTVNNCSGTSPIHLPNDFEASGGYGPQITGPQGWEEWSFAINFNVNNSLMVGKWTRGDPAAKDSNPLKSAATFSLFTNFANGTTFSLSVQDKFVYTESNNIKKMSIGDNDLIWNGNVGVWNISINANGFTFATSTILTQPGYPFIPRYKDQRALLVDGYHTSIDVPRGHMDGALRFPWGLEWAVIDVCSFKHSYATKPIQDVLSSYTRGTSFLGSVPPISTVNWYHARSCKGKEVDAVYVAKQTDYDPVTGVEGSPIDLKYQLTDDPTLLNLTTSSFNTSITLPGCEAQGNLPFRWDTYPIMQRGSFKDSAGGVTRYLGVNVSTTLWYNDTSTHVLGGIGFIEVYNSS